MQIIKTGKEEVRAIGYLQGPLGMMRIKASEKGIIEVSFLEGEEEASDSRHRKSSLVAEKRFRSAAEWVEKCGKELEEYFSGHRKSFLVNLDPQGTSFQLEVWEKLMKIQFGKSTHYGEIALKLGDIKKTRAIGMANAKNPIAIIVPCHRVIGNDGSLTGYAGGLWRKEWLLRHEGSFPGQEQLTLTLNL